MTKKIFLPLLLLVNSIAFGQVFDASNVTLMSRWFDANMPAEPQFAAKYNSCYGYYDALNNKEYAILGSTKGTHIIDVSNPGSPIEVDFVAGRRDSCVWREYKTYKHYLYAVSDDAPPNSLQIIDLSYLPDSVNVIHDSDTIFQKSHTIYIDGNKLYCGVLTTLTNQYAMGVYSLNDPEHPQFLADLESFYPQYYQVHDMFVRNDTVYASCGFEKMQIFKFDSLNNSFNQLGSLTNYPEAGYNHSSTLTQNGEYLIFADEVPAELGMKIVNVSDLSDIQITSVFRSNLGATPHNPYLKEDKVLIAYYRDGLQIFDVSNPSNPLRTGYFDTHPQNGNSYSGQAYQGAWGAYPFLPSGIVLVSDMQFGLFVLDANTALGMPRLDKKNVERTITLSPNPAETSCVILGLPESKALIELVDIHGRSLLSHFKQENSGTSLNLNLESINPGVYQIRVSYKDGGFLRKKLVKR
jgi:choice-of-anchor B domain-containing protein